MAMLFGRLVRWIRLSLVVLLARSTEAFGPLIRSVALAHLISPTDFGIAVAISITAELGEMLLDIGLDQSAVRQIEHNSGKSVLDTLHTIALFRGIILAFLMAVGALIISTYFRNVEAVFAFASIGGTSLIRSFGNLGIKEAARNYSYSPHANTILIEQTVQTILVIVFAIQFEDYRCMLYGIYASSLAYMIASHVLSPVRWRLGWSGDAASEALSFGLPLIPSGAAVAAGMVGDRFAVGSMLDLATLAEYSVISTASILPRNVILKYLVTLVLPVFVNRRFHGSFQDKSLRDRWTILLCAFGFFFGLGFLVFGQPMLTIVFGQRYNPEQLLVSVVAISACLKCLLQLPVPPALAYGDSRFILLTSVLNFASLIVGIIVLWTTKSLVSFVLGIVVADCVAVTVCIARSIRRYHFLPSLSWALSIGSITLLTTGLVILERIGTITLFERLAVALLLALLFAILVLIQWFLHPERMALIVPAIKQA